MWVDLKNNWPKRFGEYEVKVCDLFGNEKICNAVWLGTPIGFITINNDLKEDEFIQYWETSED